MMGALHFPSRKKQSSVINLVSEHADQAHRLVEDRLAPQGKVRGNYLIIDGI